MSKTDLLVVKVGTNTLIDTDGGGLEINGQAYGRIGKELGAMAAAGTKIVVVSSGAVATGLSLAGKNRQNILKTELGEYAEAGWAEVTSQWSRAMGSSYAGSALLTKQKVQSDLSDWLVYSGGIRVVNEDDTSNDIFGNNDTMAAELTANFARNGGFNDVHLVMLTNTHGLYNVAHDASTIVRRVDDFDRAMKSARGTTDVHSTGGMATKIQAAKFVSRHGVTAFIAHGREQSAISRVLSGEIGTTFIPGSATIK